MTDEEFAEQVFAVPINGVAAGTLLQSLLVYVNEMHAIHGLDALSPMTVSNVLRATGTITQDISEVSGTVTYERT